MSLEVLEEMQNTFRERGKVYGDSQYMVGKIMAILFPVGIPDCGGGILGLTDPQAAARLAIFTMIVVKLVRLASNETIMHRDSALDAGVYCAILTSLIDEAAAEEDAKNVDV